MKRFRITTQQIRQVFFALCASVLMLSVSQAQTTVGINFSASYIFERGNYASPPVTETAFGVSPANWTTTALDDIDGSITITTPNGKSFAVSWTATYSDVNFAAANTMPGYAGYPGDSEVFDGNLLGPYTVTLTGLAAQFPNGYAVQPIAATSYTNEMLPLTITDNHITNTLSYTSLGEFFDHGTYGAYGYYMPTPSLFTNDTFIIYGPPDPNSLADWLSGFIITDKPVISVPPVGVTMISGKTLSLNAIIVGVAPLHYQWRTNGVPIPGANSSTYFKANATNTDVENYDLIVTNHIGSITSSVAVVSIVKPANLVYDANPGTVGTNLDGSGTWNTTATNWWNRSDDIAWTPFAFVAFGAGVAGNYAVTLMTNVLVSGIIFNGESYTITNIGSETIDLFNPAEITVQKDATIAVPLSGTNGLVLNGPGILTLTSTNTFTGAITVSNGTLNLPTVYSNCISSIQSPIINLLPGTSLTCNAAAFGLVEYNLNTGVPGLTININRAICQPNGAFGVGYNLTGGSISGSTNRLDLGGFNGFYSYVTTYPSSTTSVINPGGGYIQLRIDDGQTNYVFTTAAGTTPAKVDLDIQVPIYENGIPCSLIKAGAGTLQLSTNNYFTGTTTVSNGTLNLPAVLSERSSSLKSSIINLLPGTSLTCNYYAFGWFGNDSSNGLTINIDEATCQPIGAFGVSYTLTGGSISGGRGRLDLGSHDGFNSFVTTYSSSTTSIINPGGDCIMLRNDSGQINYVFTTAAGTTPTKVDLDIQVPIIQNRAPCSLIKTGAGTLQLSAVNTYTGTTTVSNGTLVINGALSKGAVDVDFGSTLSGIGTIKGPVIVDGTLASSTNNPGALTINNIVTLKADSTTRLAIDRTAGTNSYGSVKGITTVKFGGTLVVNGLGSTFQNGDVFVLFKAAAYTGNFSSTILPPLGSGLSWDWNPTNGTLSVVPIAANANPTKIVATASSNE